MFCGCRYVPGLELTDIYLGMRFAKISGRAMGEDGET